MRTIGRITTLGMSALVVGALVMGLRSLPDVKRYLRIREM
jgi:hypothetical protein